MFAMGKYEVTVDELNTFCKTSSICSEAKDKDGLMPATNVSFEVVKAYLKWLSDKSDRKYRLPTRTEWQYAATARRLSLDPNRNCQLQTRGIQKGGELVKATTGRQNGWGLVNYVGNAREWVYDKGRKLVAVGGSFETAMDSCDLNSIEVHNGNADIYTGFRVLREVEETKS
jgi:formylglycine-generating enzyme required for sulfatase activity